jgi:hypothetical protein
MQTTNQYEQPNAPLNSGVYGTHNQLFLKNVFFKKNLLILHNRSGTSIG